MTITQLLILQFIAHLLTDYTFQSSQSAKNKNQYGFKSSFLKWHILITFFTSWILSFQVVFAGAALIIAVTHWLIDGFKVYLNKYAERYAFFIDQVLHLLVIGLVVFFYQQYFEIRPLINIYFDENILLITAAYLFAAKPANVLIKEVFKLYQVNFNHNNEDLPNAGRLIGITERWLVLTFILLKEFEAVGFLIAAKSILRFKDDSALKTEYVLIGTMLSFGIAIAVGIIVNLIR